MTRTSSINGSVLLTIVAGTFAFGILYQKYVTVGYTVKRLQQLVERAPDPSQYQPFGEFYSPIDHPQASNPDVKHDREKTHLRLLRETERLKAQLDEERQHAQETRTRAILAELYGASVERTPSDIQLRLGRYYPPFLVERLISPLPQIDRDRVAASIHAFAERLAREDCHLIFIPLPNPVDIDLPLYLDDSRLASCAFADSQLFISLLEKGVDVVDLRSEFRAANRAGRAPFHRLDHHWSPEGLEAAARRVHQILATEWSGWEKGRTEMESRWVTLPEVACNADFAPKGFHPGDVMARETLLRGQPVRQSFQAPVLVLGDSNVLHLAGWGGHACDFTSRLAFHSGRPLAFSGQRGGTEQAPAVYADMVGRTGIQPKVLVWVAMNGGWGALRDSSVERTVTSQSSLEQPARMEGRFTVVAVSTIPAVEDLVYPDVLYTFKVRSMSGESIREAVLITWAYRNRREVPERRVAMGQVLDLDVAGWRKACKNEPSLRRLQKSDDLEEYSLDEYFWPAPTE